MFSLILSLAQETSRTVRHFMQHRSLIRSGQDLVLQGFMSNSIYVQTPKFAQLMRELREVFDVRMMSGVKIILNRCRLPQ